MKERRKKKDKEKLVCLQLVDKNGDEECLG